MKFGKNTTGISKNIVNSSKHVCFDLDKHFSTCGTHQNTTVVLERKFERNSIKKYKTDWPKNIRKSKFSVVLGKLDNIESLLKKHMIFVLLCFAQISQTLHVCGATIKVAYFLLGIPVVVLHGLFVKLGQNISEKMGDMNLSLNWIQVKTFENLSKKAKVMCTRDS